MQVKFFCPQWGSKTMPFLAFIKLAKKEGYDGVEISFPDAKDSQKEYLSILADYGMPYIVQHHETDKNNLDDYLEEYTRRMEILADVKPLFINSQTGKDFFSFEDNCRIIEKANEIEEKSGTPVYHETHRGKFSFACHLMPDYLKAFPQMKVTADFSHWVNVSESMLEHQQENLDKVIPHVFHIHSRVGSTQSAQVNDPRTPENIPFLDRHIEWWDSIINERTENGDSEFTITPEFGPAPYMPLLPFTQQPIANQWDINKYMMDLIKSRYNNQ